MRPGLKRPWQRTRRYGPDGKRHFYEALLTVIDRSKALPRNIAEGPGAERREQDPSAGKSCRDSGDHLACALSWSRSFHEAIQAVCFIMALMHIEGTGPVYTVGPSTSILSYYKADVEKEF